MDTKATRKRKPRAIAEEKTTKATKISQTMQTNAVTFYSRNKEVNAAKVQADKARKELYSEMKESGIDTFDLKTNIEGEEIIITASIGSRSTTAIDVAALRRIVTEEQFEKIVSASKSKVEAVAGKDVAVRCSIAGSTSENVSVKPKK